MIPKKSNSADLENKRPIFLQIGLIIALSLVLAAFNWKTYDKLVVLNIERTGENVTEEMVPVTEQKPPEPPRIERPRVVININIVDNESPVDDNFVVDAEINPLDTMPVYIAMSPKMEEEIPAEEEIFKVVESNPEFPGGEAVMYDYLSKNISYPRIALEAGISGTVYVTFVVEKDGSITDVQLLRGIGGGCDEEAMRVVKSMPTWTPGKQRNVPVRVQFNFGVKFTLSQM